MWPESPCECHGVCKYTDEQSADDVGGSKSLVEVKGDGERGCPKCLLIYLSCLGFGSMKDSLQVYCSYFTPGVFELDRVDGSTNSRLDDVQIYVQAGTPKPAWDYIKPGRTPMVSRNEEYGPMLASWITECDRAHKDCTAKDARLPHRVLDVGSKTGSRISLHISSGEPEEDGRYVALSYCWGKSHPPKTTQENLAQRRQDICFDTLPRSFQDAVMVTRNIGIQYLWIDSLCIVQDHTPDWQTESANMAAYYSNAYLVIVAAQAVDPTQGFLDTLESYSHFTQHPSTEIGQITNPDSSVSRIYRRNLGGSCRYRHYRVLTESPLNTRAWALQENLLAKRIVHFTKRELLWECVEGLKCECMEVEAAARPTSRPADFLRKDQFIELRDFDETPGLGKLWLNLLRRYSTLTLSYRSDLLPALSGLAKLWESRGAGKYLAGFWQGNILESIVWTLIGAGYPQRSREYRAPSWSPFSLESADGRCSDSMTHFPIWDHFDWLAKKKNAVVLGAGVTAAGADPTGQIKSAFLQLQGHATWVKVPPAVGPAVGPESYSAREVSIRLGKDRNTVTVHFDILLDFSKGLTLLLIPICDSFYGGSVALVLERSGDAYQRVGIVKECNEDVKDQLAAGAMETVVII